MAYRSYDAFIAVQPSNAGLKVGGSDSESIALVRGEDTGVKSVVFSGGTLTITDRQDTEYQTNISIQGFDSELAFGPVPDSITPATATFNDSIAVGAGNHISNVGGLAFGTNIINTGAYSIGLGHDLTVSNNNSLEIGATSANASTHGITSIITHNFHPDNAGGILLIDTDGLWSFDTEGLINAIDAGSNISINRSNPKHLVISATDQTPLQGYGIDIVGSRGVAVDTEIIAQVSDINDATLNEGYGLEYTGSRFSANASSNKTLQVDTDVIADRNWVQSNFLGTQEWLEIGSGGATPDHALAENSNDIAIGWGAHASGIRSVAIGGESGSGTGTGAFASGRNSCAFGHGSSATGVHSLASGPGASATADSSIAFGRDAEADGIDSVAFGHGANVNQSNYCVALGPDASATASDAVAIGHGSTASNVSSLALGRNTTTTNVGQASFAGGSVTHVKFPTLTTTQRDALTWTSADVGSVIYNTTSGTLQIYHIVPGFGNAVWANLSTG